MATYANESVLKQFEYLKQAFKFFDYFAYSQTLMASSIKYTLESIKIYFSIDKIIYRKFHLENIFSQGLRKM